MNIRTILSAAALMVASIASAQTFNEWQNPRVNQVNRLPMHTAYKELGFDIADFPNAYDQFKCEVTLPLHTHITDEEADYIIVNTCCVTNTAASKSRQKINSLHKENKNALLSPLGYPTFLEISSHSHVLLANPPK